jgi:hypothetical protein
LSFCAFAERQIAMGKFSAKFLDLVVDREHGPLRRLC